TNGKTGDSGSTSFAAMTAPTTTTTAKPGATTTTAKPTTTTTAKPFTTLPPGTPVTTYCGSGYTLVGTKPLLDPDTQQPGLGELRLYWNATLKLNCAFTAHTGSTIDVYSETTVTLDNDTTGDTAEDSG